MSKGFVTGAGSTSHADSWRDIPGYGDKYQISSSGVVRSRPMVITRSDGRTQSFRGQVLSSHIDSGGYPAVRLVWMGDGRVHRVHRLLAEAFIPNPAGLRLVRHLNDIKTDLRLENLAWGSNRDNALDCMRNGNHKTAGLPACSRGHVYTEETTYYMRAGGRDCRVCIKMRRDRNRDRNLARRREAYVRKRDRTPAPSAEHDGFDHCPGCQAQYQQEQTNDTHHTTAHR